MLKRLLGFLSFLLFPLQSTGTTYQTGEDIVVRAQFINNGVLDNTQDTNFRAVEDDWPVFAFAKDLGSVTSATTPVVFSVGHVRDPVIEYIIADEQLQQRSPFFLSAHSTPADAVSPSNQIYHRFGF